MPNATTRKFAYADDIALATQGTSMNVLSSTPTADLKVMNDYLVYWHLHLNTAKSTVTAFHLNNSLAKVELQVSCQGKLVKHENYPRYLGVTLIAA